jgi:hypothetical protein
MAGSINVKAQRRKELSADQADRVDRRLTVMLFALALGLYLRTLAPGLLPGDAGEFQVAAWQLGLAHPTGYPLYLLLGSAWQHLLALVGVNPAGALNAFSALCGALAVALLYQLMLGWLHGPVVLRRLAATLSALLLAVNPTFWSQSLIAEVYTLHGVLILLILRFSILDLRLTRRDGTSRVLVNRQSSIVNCLVIGLALAHHATTVLLLPGVLIAHWLVDRRGGRVGRSLLPSLLICALPLLLYLYIPWRSGAAATPWYHQQLGTENLTLYDGSWPAFLNFVTGRSIGVGWRSVGDALGQLPQAWLLWRLHFDWLGLALILVGLFSLYRQRNWPLLALSVPYALLHQVFNLFYNIGDILVYYIPLYLMGCIWIGVGAQQLGLWLTPATASANTPKQPATFGIFAILLLFLLPLSLGRSYFRQLDQSGANGVRTQWNAIVAAQPPANAILVSNDRDEITPLFYLQAVEGKLNGRTGLFPLIKPEPRFADIGTTLDAALAATSNGQPPIYLIKPMPGLEVKFALQAVTPPLVQVLGPAADHAPAQAINAPYGPLTLLGYDWQRTGDQVAIRLYWLVNASIPVDTTTTVQLLDTGDNKLGQDDQPAGGLFYGTSHWQPGERLVDQHTLTLPATAQPVTLLVGMYNGPAFTPLAPMLRIAIKNYSCPEKSCPLGG